MPMNRFGAAWLAVFCCLLVWTGCRRTPARVAQPTYAPDAGAAAINTYDTNSDQAISGEELNAVPALKASMGAVDADKDGKITAAEINQRVDEWKESRIGKMAAICEVTLDGKPLANAEVRFDPESFLGSNLPSGTGTTSEDGSVGITVSTDESSSRNFGMPCGWYKIRVTSSSRKIPDRFNTNTVLGCEVAPYSHWQDEGFVKLDLTSE